ncbi:hypothetical protein HETIRDRAFT_455907 [Heterobasidion irregulare TC 32-1]|uniref:Uncharacterized protein n=1 Tax=Heterobasidion irregulare (strain TC 32-1) TaxID=747525 RepID=W4JQ96_HETIT|nr:uncharacterized protein HETIRDRAFT_455907 [Heterobasidion irregulare TC 32-1]ETW75255.1 hypothetical protein HETIRDRAFT_455907 [Heterobasidion irregulare TC 32-1]
MPSPLPSPLGFSSLLPRMLCDKQSTELLPFIRRTASCSPDLWNRSQFKPCSPRSVVRHPGPPIFEPPGPNPSFLRRALSVHAKMQRGAMWAAPLPRPPLSFSLAIEVFGIAKVFCHARPRSAFVSRVAVSSASPGHHRSPRTFDDIHACADFASRAGAHTLCVLAELDNHEVRTWRARERALPYESVRSVLTLPPTNGPHTAHVVFIPPTFTANPTPASSPLREGSAWHRLAASELAVGRRMPCPARLLNISSRRLTGGLRAHASAEGFVVAIHELMMLARRAGKTTWAVPRSCAWRSIRLARSFRGILRLTLCLEELARRPYRSAASSRF